MATEGPTDSPGLHRPLVERLEGVDLAGLSSVVDAGVLARRIAYGPGGAEEFDIDPVPRLFVREEWDRLAAGLVQRLRALNAFLADVHGPRRMLEAGVLPARLLDSPFFEPEAADLPMPAAWCALYGPDVVRDADGTLLVLEDNCRLPSGLGYAVAAREVVAPAMAHAAGDACPQPDDVAGPALEALRATICATAPADASGDPAAVVLTDPSGNDARFEHWEIARRLEVPLVVLEELEVHEGRCVRRDANGRRHPVDVVLRRTNVDTLRDRYGNRTALHPLLGPARAGRLGVVNAFGSGIADDKLTQAYVPAVIRTLLGEEPLLAQPETLDLGDDDVRARVLDDPGGWVLKPRAEVGGRGVVVGPHASAAALDDAVRAVRAEPGGWIAQAPVELSTHPTVVDGRLEPRRVDLRPIVLAAGDEVHVVPGGMSRFSMDADERLVNMSAGGGIKDVWVVD